MTTNPTPKFFESAQIPSVAAWAADKAKAHRPDMMEIQGRQILVKEWYFEGRFQRRPEAFFGQWDVPQNGAQYTCTVRVNGGQYRGEKPTVLVVFSEYTSADGQPLPI